MDLFDEYGGDEEEEGHEEKWDKWCDDMEIAYDDIIDKLLTGRWNTELNEDAIIRTFDDGAFHHKLAINASSLARHPHNNIKMKLFDVVHPCMFLYPITTIEANLFDRRNVEKINNVWIAHRVVNKVIQKDQSKIDDRHLDYLNQLFNEGGIHDMLNGTWNAIRTFRTQSQDRKFDYYDFNGEYAKNGNYDRYGNCYVNHNDTVGPENLPDEYNVYLKISIQEYDPLASNTGVWHCEGLPNEHIVATAVYYPQIDDELIGGKIRFIRSFTDDEVDIVTAIGQNPPKGYMNFKNMILGSLQTKEKMLISFPNTHVHCVQAITNTSPTIIRRRVIVAFFLVNPQKHVPTWHMVNVDNVIDGYDNNAPTKELFANMATRSNIKQSDMTEEVFYCEH